MRVRFHAAMRQVTGVREIEFPIAPDESVRVLLDRLFDMHPDLRSLVLDGSGQLRDSTTVLVRGRHVRFLEGLDTTLNEDDDITLLIPFAGG